MKKMMMYLQEPASHHPQVIKSRKEFASVQMKGGVLENRSRELVTYLQLFFGERILVDVPSICMRTPKLSNGFGDSGFNG